MSKTPAPPKHLKGQARSLFVRVAAEYDVSEQHHRALLQAACEQLQEAEQLRQLIAKEGSMVLDRFQQTKAHPALAEMRQCHNSFRLLLRELGLDIEGATTEVRGPRSVGYVQ